MTRWKWSDNRIDFVRYYVNFTDNKITYVENVTVHEIKIERFLRIPRETRVGQFTGNLLIGGGCNSRNVIEGSGKKKYISGFRTPLLRLLFQFHPIPVCHTQNVAFSFVRWKRLVGRMNADCTSENTFHETEETL